MLATLSEQTAHKVAEDIRDFGHGYVRIDRDGRAEHIPPYTVIGERSAPEPAAARMHE